VIDSIQTIYSEISQSSPGSVTQVKECASQLVNFAKTNDITIFLIGHVTKDGALAGPRVLEHMVDVTL
ncbi:DNA repair protein RadA, partial [Pseudomonadota bacterium]|nr:DNA repair protein RadA [Pseudomonadota bacterium]